ncbi:MAG: 4'-phosphopantetheinyl transferase family protein [Candidatus Electronema sp. V4]|uniref:4'-phosphopantetheinyl transferase family protein n=1 Tax=Candidatus Electronema sp. V4 TaxID=3454756 RepID=UPI0040558951
MKITTNTCPEASALLAAFFPAAFAWGRLRSEAQDCAALVDLTELHDEDAARQLSDAEQEFFQQLRHPKRRREWLGGRIAAKAALLNLPEDAAFAAQARRLTILPDAQGRPTVSGGADNFTLSITHSGRYAAALAVQGRHCGIDLQVISAKLPLLTKYFAAAAELELLAEQLELGSETAALTMLWAVKEAVKKSLPQQPGMFAGIAAEGIAAAGDRAWRFQCGAQAATAYVFPPYVLALTSGAACAASPSFL